MTLSTVVRSVMPFVLGMIALCFVGLGLYGLGQKRPFVLRARWMLLLLLVCFSPSLVMQVAVLLDMRGSGYSGSLRTTSVIASLVVVVVLVFMAIASRGYLVFSATQSSFRDGVVAALTRLELPFEETLATIRLPAVPAELQVAVQGWIGTGQLRLKSRGGGVLLRDVARAMTDQFKVAPGATNRTWAVVYLILGALMGAMAAAMMFA